MMGAKRMKVNSGAAVCVAMPPPPPPSRVEIFLPPAPGQPLDLATGGGRLAAVNAPAVVIVRIGLWDNAWDAHGNLRNGAAAANSFIDLDTRCFYFRVFDDEAGVQNLATRTVQWGTRHTNGPLPAADDAAAVLTLQAVLGHPGYFVSRAVMLVADADDRARAHPGEARLRRVTVDDAHPLTSDVRVEYAPAPSVADPHPAAVAATATVFNQGVGHRNRVRVHFVNVRRTNGGTRILPVGTLQNVKAAFQAVYAVCGVFAAIDEIVVDPPAACTGWGVRYAGGGDPSVEVSTQGGANPAQPQFDPSPTELALAGTVRGLPGYQANDVYVVFVWNLYSTPLPPPNVGNALDIETGGEAFTDAQTATLPAAGQQARGIAFVAVDHVTRYAAVHEATHLTTDFNNEADGHYDLGDGNAGPGPIDGKNLMHRFVLVDNAAEANPKRLWDTPSAANTWANPFINGAQITAILASRFVHTY